MTLNGEKEYPITIVFRMKGNTMKAIIYSRVSSVHQDVEMQNDILIDLCKKMEYELVEIIEDKAVSGGVKGRDRKGMNKLLKMVTKREVDVVLVYSVDRLGRKLSDVLQMAEMFAENKVGLVIHKNGINTTTTYGKHMLSFFALIAEMEKDFINSRIKDGIALAIKKGKQIGRKKVSLSISKEILLLRSQGKGINSIAKTLSVGNSTIQRVIKESTELAA